MKAIAVVMFEFVIFKANRQNDITSSYVDSNLGADNI